MKGGVRLFLWASVGGALAAFAVWQIASRQLDKQFQAGGQDLRRQLAAGGQDLEAELNAGRRELIARAQQEIQTQVPARVRQEVDAALANYGVTPQTAREAIRVARAGDALVTRLQRFLQGVGA